MRDEIEKVNSETIQKRDDVILGESHDGHRVLHHPQSRQYFRLGLREAKFYDSLVDAATKNSLYELHKGEFSPEEIDAITDWFRQQGLLAGGDIIETKEEKRSFFGNILQFLLRPDSFRFTIWDPNATLDYFRKSINLMFSPAAIALYIFIFISPVLLLFARPDLGASAIRDFTPLNFQIVLVAYIAILIINAFHELAHAMVCKAFGGNVHKIGLLFLYFSPVVYSDVSDSWRFTSRSQKIAVASAGIAFQLILTSIGLCLWLITSNAIIAYVVFANTMLALINLFPFIKLDGYWIVAHILNEPNLMSKSRELVLGKIRDLVVNHRIQTPDNERSAVLAFGMVSSVVVPAFWMLGLYGLYYRLSQISPLVAMIVVSAFSIGLLYRVYLAARVEVSKISGYRSS